MDPEDIVVEIRSAALGRLGQISMDDVNDLKLNKRFNNVGSWSLTLPAESESAALLAQPGRGIIARSSFQKKVLDTPAHYQTGAVTTNLLTNPSFEAAGATVTTRTNLCTNPNAETNTTGWTVESGATLARDTVSPIDGAASFKLTGPGDVYTVVPGVQVGDVYTFSVDYTTVGTITGTPQLYMGTTSRFATQALPLTQTAPGRFSVTGTVNAAGNLICAVFAGGSGTVLHFDNVLIEKTSIAQPYFDGNTAAAGDFTYAWTGTADASTSIQQGVTVTGASVPTATNGGGVQSSLWSKSGSKSLRCLTVQQNYTGFCDIFPIPVTPGATYTIVATGWMPAPQTGTGVASNVARAIGARFTQGSENLIGPQMNNAAGEQTLYYTFTVPANRTTMNLRLYQGPYNAVGDVWWDNIALVEGAYTGSAFNGDTENSTGLLYAWSGPANNSTSTMTQNVYIPATFTNETVERVLLSGTVVNYVKDQNTDDIVGTYTFTGADDNKHLADALAWPDPTNPDLSTQEFSNDIRTGVAEDVIRDFVAYNIGDPYADDPANPHVDWGDNNRKIKGLTLQIASAHQGNVVTGNARFDQLGKLVGDCAQQGGVGFDIVQVSSTRKELQIYTPTDKSDLIRMDIDNDLLDKTAYGFGAPTATRVVVAGQGVGTDRQLLLVTSPSAEVAEDAWGFKVEVFKDRRDTSDESELLADGQSIVDENGKTITSLSVTPSDNVTMVYGRDWFLGDIVGVDVDGVPMKAVVTEATISISDQGLVVAATVGDPTGFDYDSKLIAKQQNQETRLAFLEKNAEVGQTLATGIVDPAWSSGLPNVTFDGASGPVETKGWLSQGGYNPSPGERVLAARAGLDWYIAGPVGTDAFGSYGERTVEIETNAGVYIDGYRSPLVATRTKDGMIVMDGLITKSGWRTPGSIGRLPEGFRPDYRLKFGVNNNDNPRSIDIDEEGWISVNGQTVDGYISFAGVCFPAAGTAVWNSADITLQNGWAPNNASDGVFNYGPIRAWIDPHGCCWVQGNIQAGSTAANTQILSFSQDKYKAAYDNYQVQTSNDVYGCVGATSSVAGMVIEPNTQNGWLSLSKTWYETPATDIAWTQVTFQSGWADYAGTFPLTGYTKMDNGMVRIRGFVRSGSIGGNGSPIFTLPAGYRPGKKMIFDAVSWDSFARINIDPDGKVYCSAGNNGWVSLNGQLVFMAKN